MELPAEYAHLCGTAEVAHILGVDVSTVSKMVTRGELKPVIQLPGKTGSRLFDRAEVAAMKRERDARERRIRRRQAHAHLRRLQRGGGR